MVDRAIGEIAPGVSGGGDACSGDLINQPTGEIGGRDREGLVAHAAIGIGGVTDGVIEGDLSLVSDGLVALGDGGRGDLDTADVAGECGGGEGAWGGNLGVGIGGVGECREGFGRTVPGPVQAEPFPGLIP